MREQPRQQASQSPRDSGGRESDPCLQKQVKNTLTKRQSRFREYYTSYLTTGPETKSGRVVLDWQILAAGAGLRPEGVRSDFPQATLGECLRDEVARMNFPPPPSGTARYVEHTFHFDFQQEN